MKTLGWILFAAGAVIFVVDFASVAFSGGNVDKAPFIGNSGLLAGIQSYVPFSLDYGLMAAGAGILLYEKYA